MPASFSQYERTFTSFGGPDIVPMFNNKVIGECQAITYSIRREKAQPLKDDYITMKYPRRAHQTNTSTMPITRGLLKRSSKRGNPNVETRAIPWVRPMATSGSRRDSGKDLK